MPLSNSLACATDGAPSMVGVLTVHCVIHRQHLVAKNVMVNFTSQ